MRFWIFSSIARCSLFYISILLLLSCNAKEKPIEMKEGSLQLAIEEAQKENKTLVAIVSKEGCSPCDILAKSIIAYLNNGKDPKVIHSSNYIFYKIDTDIPENVWVNQWLNELAFPTSCIITSKGRLLTTITNGSPKNFFAVLQQIDKNRSDSIYKENMSELTLKNKDLQSFLNQVLQVKLAMLKSENKATWIKDSLLSSLNKESYFYNNYLLSKYYKATTDTVTAKVYAEKALSFKTEMDALLYTPLRTEMNYTVNKNLDLATEPYMATDKTEFDYGEMKPGGEGSASFSIINQGKKPLLIERAIASCSCTSVDWDKQPIAPGKSTLIKVKFKDKSKTAGIFQQSVQIFSNAYNAPITLTVKARIF